MVGPLSEAIIVLSLPWSTLQPERPLGQIPLTSPDPEAITPPWSYLVALQPSACTPCLLLETFLFLFCIDRLPKPSHASGPLLPTLLGLLGLHYGAFMFWNSSRLGPNPTVLTLYSLAVPLHYQCFKTFYWLMIRKFESLAQTPPWSSRLTNPTASFPSPLWYF